MLAAAVLYTVRLNGVPPSLSTDETAFALQAHAIATTAHDTNGRLLPLYFQMVENVWFHPALVYAMACRWPRRSAPRRFSQSRQRICFTDGLPATISFRSRACWRGCSCS